MRYRFEGLIFRGAYTLGEAGGLFSELYGIYPGVNQIPVTASVTCDRAPKTGLASQAINGGNHCDLKVKLFTSWKGLNL